MIVLMQVLASGDHAQFVTNCEPLTQLIEVAGCVPLTNSVENKSLLVKNLCHFHLLGRSALAIEQ